MVYLHTSVFDLFLERISPPPPVHPVTGKALRYRIPEGLSPDFFCPDCGLWMPDGCCQECARLSQPAIPLLSPPVPQAGPDQVRAIDPRHGRLLIEKLQELVGERKHDSGHGLQTTR